MSKYSVTHTIKEQREKMLSEVNGISDLGGTKLSELGKKLLNRYVDGELEIEKVQKIMIENYTDNRK